MSAAETGADYVMFGEPDAEGQGLRSTPSSSASHGGRRCSKFPASLMPTRSTRSARSRVPGPILSRSAIASSTDARGVAVAIATPWIVWRSGRLSDEPAALRFCRHLTAGLTAAAARARAGSDPAHSRRHHSSLRQGSPKARPKPAPKPVARKPARQRSRLRRRPACRPRPLGARPPLRRLSARPLPDRIPARDPARRGERRCQMR